MKILLALLGGASALFLAMGVARFAFTPVLPLMQSDYGFTDSVSGALASVNYLGYLLGAFAARYLSVTRNAYKYFLISIPASILFVSAMYTANIDLWYFFRFASGFISAVVFIMTAEFVMDFLTKHQRPQLGGMIYSGIGAGMVLSGMTIPLLSKYFNSSQIWLWLAGLSLLPAFFALYFTPKPESGQRVIPKSSKKTASLIYLLCAAYLLEGAGYIITGTFISVIVMRGTGSVMLSGYVWVIAGLGAVFITPLWAMLTKKIGIANTIITAFAVQAFAIALPVLSKGLFATMLGAVGFGGTFLGIVSLVLAYGRVLSPGGVTTSVLTVFFSIGQMIGPLVAGYIADKTGGFDYPVLMAATAALSGGLLTYIIKKGENNANS